VKTTKVGEVFGAGIRGLRTEREWTQEDLADAAGLTATYVGQIERGDKVPSLTVLMQLARGLLQLPPAELLSGFSAAVLRTLKL
jgi:XRE family transcriptional regulator, regulator of sulfur utilization